jgi:hydroxymethylpyrimidine pyrophosphatase-like HAD family hydrolase
MEQQRDYINFVNPLVERVQAQISTEIPQVGCYEGGAIYQASIYLEPGQEALLQACLPESVRTVRWNSDGVDVIPSTGGKNEGIKMMMRHHGLCREEVMAIGDGDNDEQMVRFAGIGVCMGNGVEKTKQAADYVTDHIDNDGLEKAFAHFGLL